jgi:hypothetical protein
VILWHQIVELPPFNGEYFCFTFNDKFLQDGGSFWEKNKKIMKIQGKNSKGV